MVIFGPKPWENLWKNVNFSTFWSCCFYSLERRFFVLEYRKRHFPGLYCLKKKVWIMSIFRPIPFNNFHGKMSIFWHFQHLVFIASKGVFSSYIILKAFSWPILLKKKVGKMAIFRPKPWKNVNFSTFWTSYFYSLERHFFVLEYRKGHLKKKSWKKAHCWTKTMG